MLGALAGGFLVSVWVRHKYGRLLDDVRKKEEKKKTIMKFMRSEGKMNNEQVEILVHVSDSTAERYLDELEKEGKITQVGKTGKHVYYQIAE